jgi:anaerobic selenocysteine-containing dehydrogenase
VSEVIERSGPEAVLPWFDAGTQGAIQQSTLGELFFDLLGASRQDGALCGDTARAGFAATYGSGKGADPSDVAHAEVVLLWGTNTRLTNRHLWPSVERARGNGATVVVIDPLRTLTAEAADWFVQPLPGTDVALVLAIAHVLIRDGLIDTDYIDAYTEGFEDLADLAKSWPPTRAADATGLAADEIERLAALYGSTKKAFIRTLIGAEHREHGGAFFQALGTLPLLTGAWRELGGGIARSVGSWLESTVHDEAFSATDSTRRPLSINHLGRHLTDPEVGIEALFVWCGNPVVSTPNAAAIRRGLERDDLFCVVSELFMTDTAQYADVIFPATTQIEQLDVVPAWGHLYLGWNEPAIAPLGESVPNTELWRRLANAFGFTDPRFSLSDAELLECIFPQVDLAALRTRGFTRLEVPLPLVPYAEGGFDTESGRASLRLPLTDQLPGVHEVETHSEFPLLLQSSKTHTRFLNSSYSHLHGHLESGPYVEISAVDAAERRIAEGDTVAVWNDRARLELQARVSDRVRPGVVAIPWGWWGAEANVNALTSDAPADIGGGVAYLDTAVEVAAVSPGVYGWNAAKTPAAASAHVGGT